MLPLVAINENQVIPKSIETNYFAPTKIHIHYKTIKIYSKKSSKVINNKHNLQTQTTTIIHQTFQIKLIKLTINYLCTIISIFKFQFSNLKFQIPTSNFNVQSPHILLFKTFNNSVNSKMKN